MSATVTLDGRDVTGVTLNGLTITRGRQSIYDDVATGVCVATLLSGDLAPDAWQGESGYTDVYADKWVGLEVAARVGVPMTVETGGVSGYTDVYADLWDGSGDRRFTGLVTAVDYTPGELTITAVDALEQLGRVYVTASRGQETDFNRAYAYAKLAGVEMGYTGTLTVDLAEVAPQPDPQTALIAVVKVSDNTDAQVYADVTNALYYRRRDTALRAPVTLPPVMTLTDNLIVSEELGAIFNVERVAYGKADARQSVERINQTSITKYGRREWRTYDTQLLNLVDASALADYWLNNDTNSAYRISDVEVLILAQDSQWSAIADSIDLFTPIIIPQLPAGSPIDTYAGIVLGYTETITQTDRILTLHLSHPDYLMEGHSYAVATPAR